MQKPREKVLLIGSQKLRLPLIGSQKLGLLLTDSQKLGSDAQEQRLIWKGFNTSACAAKEIFSTFPGRQENFILATKKKR